MFWNKKTKNKYGDVVEKLYKDNPDFAMRIAMGEEKAPNGILSTAVYAKVCDEIEKSVREAYEANNEAEKDKQIDVCTLLANSHNNKGISAEAQRLGLRKSDAYIETLKGVVNARRETFEKSLPRGKTYEVAIKEEVEKINKEIEKSKPSDEEVKDFTDSLGESPKT